MRQRSLRLPASTLEHLDELAAERGESGNAVAARLLEEALRRERHPLIAFREGATGRRPALAGTRLDVWKVMETVWASGNSIEKAAEWFELPAHEVRACVRYYAEFREEVDAWGERERAAARRAEESRRSSLDASVG